MTFEPIWGLIIASYLFLAGLGGGAFAASTYLRLRSPHCVHLIRYGRIIGPVTVIVGLVLLMFDATAGFHNPLRFVFLLTNFGSVMTWGVVFLGAFVIISLIVAVMDLVGRGLKIPVWLDVSGAVLGICVCVYTGCGITRSCRCCSWCRRSLRAWRPSCLSAYSKLRRSSAYRVLSKSSTFSYRSSNFSWWHVCYSSQRIARRKQVGPR